MPPATAPSNIRAFVHWRDPTVYAGEEIECIITFKNIARPPGQEEQDEPPAPLANGRPKSRGAPSATHSRRGSAQVRPSTSRAPSVSGSTAVSSAKRHRPALSLNVVSGGSRGGLHSAPLQAKTPTSALTPSRGHGRSLSIMSLGSDVASEGRTPTASQPPKRPARGHGRSASLQLLPRQPPLPSPGLAPMPSRHPSPLFEATTPPALPEGQGEPLPIRPARRRPGTVSASTAPQVPQLSRQSSHSRAVTEGNALPEFQFPAKPPADKSPPPSKDARQKPTRSPSTMHSGQYYRNNSPRPPDGWSGALGNLNPVSRVMSESSAGGTPRASSEFYSTSNHSDETLTSEVPQANGRLLPKPPPQSRHSSRSRQGSRQATPAEPETLMMGYAQTMGSFTLDGSLVNAAPFEEVKRKGVQGGGGVVGLERNKRASGMFGAFSWGNIGESLSGLMGGDEMSSMAQMKATAGNKSVPLLSTPQSLLFVDLRLAPGESRSYNYRFQLPRGLPPSHRGRAMKVNYHIALGVQRPGGQSVKQIEVPFRLLGSYNSKGETLGHDLWSPYILLHDAARTKSIAPAPTSPGEVFPRFEEKEQKARKEPKQGLEDFLRYTERLIEHQRATNGELLSPTSPTPPVASSSMLDRRQSTAETQPSSLKEVIDLAVLRSNISDQSSGAPMSGDVHSSNRFNIAQSGEPVAVLTMLRPAWKVGEAVIGTLDFTAPSMESKLPPQASTYSVLVELESAERVEPSLALRSGSSIQRVAKKVYASAHENAVFARKVSFHLVIPPWATPTFETTGVNLVWNLRIEFTVQRQGQQHQSFGADGNGNLQNGGDMLEELGTDERGTALIARERLPAEVFEIAVPIRVYGAPGADVGVAGQSEALEI